MDRLALWIRTERYVGTPLRILFIFAALAFWRSTVHGAFRVGAFPGWWAYLVFFLATLLLLHLTPRARHTWPALVFAQLVDLLFISYIITQTPTVTGPVLALYALWMGKQILLAGTTPVWYVSAFLTGPAYVLALRHGWGHWGFLRDELFYQTYTFLMVGALLGWVISRHIYQLHKELGHEREVLAQKTEVLQRTATDLGIRVLELRALQDIAHQLSTSLHLEDIVQLTVERARDLFSGSHAALFLTDGAEHTWRPAYTSGSALPPPPPRPSAQLLQHLTLGTPRPLPPGDPLVERVNQAWGEGELIAVPLITRGRLIAFLLLHRPADAAPFDERQQQLAESFAFLAATAIENARLYENVVEQRQELEAVLQGIGDAVIVTDRELNVLLVNPVAMRTLHWHESPVGRPLAQVIHNPELVELVREVITQQGGVLTRDITFTHPGDKPHTYQAVTSPIRSHGEAIRGAVTVLRDITAQKELERMKSNFISVISHELKTPLHSIKGFVEIIRMGKAGPITDLQADFLTTVKEQTQVLQRMIDDLLVFSRLEAGELKMHVEEISLAAIADRVVQKLTPIAEEKGILLHNQIPHTLPDIEGDYMRMEQVLTNLVENALKFTPSGGKVTVGGEDRGEKVRIWVQDTGIGIPESEQERIFERFYQVDTSERRAYRGAGLGLTICKYIVERHHGRIWVESTPGRGSTFYVELPKRLPPIHEPLDFYG
ncbi:MAG: PAS domain-containing protein [Chloroflexi bacterium]|nr:PAS domain-containing protein [Chloroflexota bacterium]